MSKIEVALPRMHEELCIISYIKLVACNSSKETYETT